MTHSVSQLISATATRAWCMQDPILDWLDLYGAGLGFLRDEQREGYDADTDMGVFLREKGRLFEAAVMRCIEDRFKVVRVASSSRDAHDPEMLNRTLGLIRDGVEIIYQAVVQDSVRGTCGIPDLLVPSDVLNRLVRDECIAVDGESSASFDHPFHYRVIDIKFTSLGLTAKGMIGNEAGDRRRKAQLLVYNRALAEAQGYEPPVAYVFGRGYSFEARGIKYRGDECFDRLGPADMRDPSLGQLVEEGISWARLVREEGASWSVLPRPSRRELYPNMSNAQDSPWHGAKAEIARAIGELTLLWRVTPNSRPVALEAGVVRFSDPDYESAVFGLSKGYEAKLQKIIEINRSGCPDLVRPARVGAGEDEWRVPNPLEFYVDFETVSDLDDDFLAIPRKGGQTLIYMVGCGHIENGEWKFEAFTCDRLTVDCERVVLDAWHAHMASVKARLWPGGAPLVFHWSHAEKSFYSNSYCPALARHPNAGWPDLNWYDFLTQVVHGEPVTVKGALAFGLKAVAKAMHANGLTETEWTNGPGSGLDAMVGAWRCDGVAAARGGSMRELPLMKGIEDYNEVDCRVMWEIVSYLRAHH